MEGLGKHAEDKAQSDKGREQVKKAVLEKQHALC